MRIILLFLVSLAFAARFSHANHNKAEVVGVTECADCANFNFDPKQAFQGLRVTIDCKAVDGHFKTRGSGDLDEHGHFKVSLPNDIVKAGREHTEECYAQLHSASSAPCPAHESLESSKIVFSEGKTAQKSTFGLPGSLKFSPVTCASKFFFHHFHNHPFFHHPAPPKEKPVDLPPPAPKKEKPVDFPPPAPKKEKPAPKKEPCPPKKEKPEPKKEKPAPKKEKPEPKKEKPEPKKEPCPPKKEKPAPKKEKPEPKKEKPAPKKEPCPPKKEKPEPKKEKPAPKEEPEIKPPSTPVVEPNPPETPTHEHPFFKHPFFKHPFFKHLPSHPFLPPHHP